MGAVQALDAEYAAWVATMASGHENDAAPSPPEIGTYDAFLSALPAMRQSNEAMIRSFLATVPAQSGIVQSSYTISSRDGASINVVRFGPAQTAETSKKLEPAIVFLHGGGMVFGSILDFAPRIAELAALSGVQIFAVEYRLAPEHPFPAATDDAFASLEWLASCAESLRVDANRIGLMGESSGGGLAAAVALMSRDRGFTPSIKKTILVYPMLDDRSITSWANSRETTLLGMCWKAYLGEDKAGKQDLDISPYAAPARARDLGDLPSTYLEVGELDDFRDECVEFAARLSAAGNACEFHVWPGVPHGFDAARDIAVTKQAMTGRLRAIKELVAL